jgi:hypothetical protein
MGHAVVADERIGQNQNLAFVGVKHSG